MPAIVSCDGCRRCRALCLTKATCCHKRQWFDEAPLNLCRERYMSLLWLWRFYATTDVDHMLLESDQNVTYVVRYKFRTLLSVDDDELRHRQVKIRCGLCKIIIYLFNQLKHRRANRNHSKRAHAGSSINFDAIVSAPITLDSITWKEQSLSRLICIDSSKWRVVLCTRRDWLPTCFPQYGSHSLSRLLLTEL